MARKALWSAALLRRFGSFITEDGKEQIRIGQNAQD
jgi:hypothetical protein